jgi:hypothetical protein
VNTARAIRKAAPNRQPASELLKIPGVGRATLGDFHVLGIFKIADLKRRDPQQLYDELCERTGLKHDRCCLYVFRCAVYFATHTRHDPEKLKWWAWKDQPR